MLTVCHWCPGLGRRRGRRPRGLSARVRCAKPASLSRFSISRAALRDVSAVAPGQAGPGRDGNAPARRQPPAQLGEPLGRRGPEAEGVDGEDGVEGTIESGRNLIDQSPHQGDPRGPDSGGVALGRLPEHHAEWSMPYTWPAPARTSSATASPGPKPISRTWSAGCTPSSETTQPLRCRLDGRAGQWAVASQTVIGRDVPDHTRLRRQTNKWFTPKIVKEWATTTAAVTAEILDRMNGDTLDGWHDLSVLPTHRTMCRVLQFPDDDAAA